MACHTSEKLRDHDCPVAAVEAAVQGVIVAEEK
jgi:hypothetical protein